MATEIPQDREGSMEGTDDEKRQKTEHRSSTSSLPFGMVPTRPSDATRMESTAIPSRMSTSSSSSTLLEDDIFSLGLNDQVSPGASLDPDSIEGREAQAISQYHEKLEKRHFLRLKDTKELNIFDDQKLDDWFLEFEKNCDYQGIQDRIGAPDKYAALLMHMGPTAAQVFTMHVPAEIRAKQSYEKSRDWVLNTYGMARPLEHWRKEFTKLHGLNAHPAQLSTAIMNIVRKHNRARERLGYPHQHFSKNEVLDHYAAGLPPALGKWLKEKLVHEDWSFNKAATETLKHKHFLDSLTERSRTNVQNVEVSSVVSAGTRETRRNRSDNRRRQRTPRRGTRRGMSAAMTSRRSRSTRPVARPVARVAALATDVCGRCGGRGHWKRECPSAEGSRRPMISQERGRGGRYRATQRASQRGRQAGRGRSRRPPQVNECFNCNQTGHWANECPMNRSRHVRNIG